MTRYIQWNFDKNEAVEYQRHGECNRCGQCCKTLIKFRGTLHPELPENATYEDEDIRNGVMGADYRGIWNEVQNERGDRRFFGDIQILPDEEHNPCSELRGQGDEHSCNVHFDKTLLCSAWPLSPDHVTPFAECSYKFEEINRWRIDND